MEQGGVLKSVILVNLFPVSSYGLLTTRNGFLIRENVENHVSHAYIARVTIFMTRQGGGKLKKAPRGVPDFFKI